MEESHALATYVAPTGAPAFVCLYGSYEGWDLRTAHGVRYVATLFGVVMLSHQVGGFLGAWLGGKAFEATGSYVPVFLIAGVAYLTALGIIHLLAPRLEKVAL